LPGIWRKELLPFVVVLTLAAALGWAIGHTLSSVCLLLAGWTLRHQIHLYRIQRWIGSSRSSSPPKDAGVCGGMIDFVLEVERSNRKHKRKLARLLKGFQEAMAALPEAAVVLDKRGRAEWWNGEAVRLLGLPMDTGASPPISDIVQDREFAQYLEGGQFQTALELPSPVDCRIRLSVRVVPYGRGKRLLMQARDVTQLRQLEEIRRDFVANTSHELRNPLTVILGYLETMVEAQDLKSGPWGRPIGQMHLQAVRIRGIVEDMLTLSTLESAECDHQRQFVDVAALLRTLKEEAEILGAEKRHRVTLEVEPGSTLQANTEEIRSAFSNLLSNAVRYTPPEGLIRLRWWIDADGGHLAVSDNGIGIDGKHIPRLTERFYRVDTARSRETGGTGLGLAIVKHALGRAGAHLSVESELGVGSTFTCHFPSRLLAHAGGGEPAKPVSATPHANIVPITRSCAP